MVVGRKAEGERGKQRRAPATESKQRKAWPPKNEKLQIKVFICIFLYLKRAVLIYQRPYWSHRSVG